MSLGDEALAWPAREVARTPGILMDFVVDEVTTPAGTVMVRNYLSHPAAVGVIVVDERGWIGYLRQYRHPVRRRLVEAPAGLLDQAGEDPLAAAQRELAEEFGYAAADWAVLVDLYVTPGSSTQAVRIYLARDLQAIPRPADFVLADEEADMELGWAPADELVEAILAGRVMNQVLVSGVLAYQSALLSGRLADLRRPGQL